MRRTISTLFLATGFAVLSFVGLAGSAIWSSATADAQTVACGGSYQPTCVPTSSTSTTVAQTTTTTLPDGTTTTQVAAGSASKSSPTVPTKLVNGPATASGGSLAFTGADVAFLGGLAVVVIGGGFLLFRISRTRKA